MKKRWKYDGDDDDGDDVDDHDSDDVDDHDDVSAGKTVQKQQWRLTRVSIRPGTFFFFDCWLDFWQNIYHSIRLDTPFSSWFVEDKT